MLRDLLVQINGFETWPCDEINYIWRHGNRRFDTDEFLPQMATEQVSQYIRRKFSEIQSKTQAETVVEKTCANSLRCGFVHKVFPNARFIEIIRDGRDVAASALLRWSAKLDLKYVLRKARYVPFSDLPFYGSRYLMNRVHRITSGEKRLATWGPKFTGIEEVFRTQPLSVACAIQWKHCVQKSQVQLSEIPAEQIVQIRYEDFVSHPRHQLGRVYNFLGIQPPEQLPDSAVEVISSKSVGRWKSVLDPDEVDLIQASVGDCLSNFGYLENEKQPEDSSVSSVAAANKS